MKGKNYSVKSTGDVITFSGRYSSDRGQAAAITFYVFVGMLCCGLVLSIAAPGGSLWYGLVLLTPAAPWYYFKNADRCAKESVVLRAVRLLAHVASSMLRRCVTVDTAMLDVARASMVFDGAGSACACACKLACCAELACALHCSRCCTLLFEQCEKSSSTLSLVQHIVHNVSAARREEEFSIKMVTSDDEKTVDVVVQGDEEEITRMTKELGMQVRLHDFPRFCECYLLLLLCFVVSES